MGKCFLKHMNHTMQMAILKCIDDHQDWIEQLDSLLFSVQYETGMCRHVSNDDDDVSLQANNAFSNEEHGGNTC